MRRPCRRHCCKQQAAGYCRYSVTSHQDANIPGLDAGIEWKDGKVPGCDLLFKYVARSMEAAR